jgi:hypothetical protein
LPDGETPREEQEPTASSLQEASFWSAMSLWQLGRQAEARDDFRKSAKFMDDRQLAHPAALRVRAEAAELLGID